MGYIDDETSDKFLTFRILHRGPTVWTHNGVPMGIIGNDEVSRIEHVEDVWHPPPFEPRPDLVITPATDQTVRIKFDKKEHEISIPRELETESDVTVIISPLPPKE